MSNQKPFDPATAVLALLACQGMCVAESLMRGEGANRDLEERLTAARFSAEALAQFAQACDAVPGGPGAARTAFEPIVGLVDEFWLMTKPRARAEQWLRVMAVATFELELVQRASDHLCDADWEPVDSAAGLWRAIDHGSQVTLQAISDRSSSIDDLSLYARRLLGETAMLGQRLLVRQQPLRQALTGQPDDEVTVSTAVLGEVLSAVAARLSQLGLSV